MVMKIQFTVFWVVTPCSVVVGHYTVQQPRKPQTLYKNWMMLVTTQCNKPENHKFFISTG